MRTPVRGTAENQFRTTVVDGTSLSAALDGSTSVSPVALERDLFTQDQPTAARENGPSSSRSVGPAESHALGIAKKFEIASQMTTPGGTGTQEDVALVIAELVKLPLPILGHMQKNGVRVVVCRNSITEVLTHLRGVRPNGWPPGASWDNVHGSGGDPVVIATDARSGRRVLNHEGSFNIVLHEVGHALDRVSSQASLTGKFRLAREAHLDRLPAYFLQAEPAGQSETYAESFAQVFGGDQTVGLKFPKLQSYWVEVAQA